MNNHHIPLNVEQRRRQYTSFFFESPKELRALGYRVVCRFVKYQRAWDYAERHSGPDRLLHLTYDHKSPLKWIVIEKTARPWWY